MSAPHAVRRLLNPVLALGMIASFLVVAGVAKPAGTAWSNPLTASVVGSAGVDVDCPAPVQPTGADRTFDIDDSAHLMWIRDDSTLWDDTLVMTADIDMGSCVWSSPIAQRALPLVQFSGIFDGRGFQISNLSVAVNTASVDDSKVDVAGFIGYLDGSGQLRDTVFRNALVTFDDTNNFDDSTLNAKTSNVAIAVGSRDPGATVEGVHVMYSIVRATMANAALPSGTERYSHVGGVIGNSGGNSGGGVVSDLQTTGNVLDNLNDQAGAGGGSTGGIIGRNEASTSGLQSSDDSIFTRAGRGSHAGGLIGTHFDGVVTEGVVISPRVSAVGTESAYAGGAFGDKSSAGASGIRVTGGSVRSDAGSQTAFAGGVTGRSLSGGYSIDVHSTGTTVTATGSSEVYAGGVIGAGSDDTVSQLSSSATVSALHAGTPGEPFVRAGGLIGLHGSGILLNSFATGNVTASSDDTAGVAAGGLVGRSLAGKIQHVYATGNATATSTLGGSAKAGGLIGDVAATVENAYSTGKPVATAPGIATATVGGLLGVVSGDIRGSFWNTTTSQASTSAGGIGVTKLTTTQVRSGASPIDTWGVVEGWQAQTFAGSPPLATAPFWGQCNVNSGFPFLLWQFAADPCSVDPPSPPPAVPSGPPRDVSAVAGDASVSVAWQAPASSGTFPVSTYQVQGSPSGTCVATAPARTCEITGLTNDVAYTFEVRALTGAGWGAWSLASNAVTPQPVVSPSIVISGSRADVRGKPGIIVTGVTQGFGMGAILRPWVRLPGQTTFTQGAAQILVDESGDVTWQRRVGKKVTVYLATPDGSVKSKRITIPKSGPQ